MAQCGDVSVRSESDSDRRWAVLRIAKAYLFHSRPTRCGRGLLLFLVVFFLGILLFSVASSSMTTPQENKKGRRTKPMELLCVSTT
jgi:hypothetical protein